MAVSSSSSSSALFYHLATLVVCAYFTSAEDGAIELAAVHTLDTANATAAPEPAYEVKERVELPKNSMGVPDFSLIENNRVCLRASFESKIVIKYKTTETSKLPTRVLEVSSQVPSDAAVSGHCTEDMGPAVLKLSWDAYTLTFNFTMETVTDTASPSPIMTWAATGIAMTINTNSSKFHTPQNGGIHEVVMTDSARFNAVANYSFSCASQQEITLVEPNTTEAEEVIPEVSLSMWSTQIQAYDLPADGEFKEAAQCLMDISIPAQNTVPIAVAAVLAIVIFVLLIVYFVMRHKSKLNYKAFE